jgi:hypothetical protein
MLVLPQGQDAIRGWLVMTIRPAPKPPFTIKQRQRLQSRPRPVDPRAARETFERDGWLCMWCKRPGGRLVPHHRFRRSSGGRDEAKAMVSTHVLCHDAIHTTHIVEARRRGFLVRSEDELAEPVT